MLYNVDLDEAVETLAQNLQEQSAGELFAGLKRFFLENGARLLTAAVVFGIGLCVIRILLRITKRILLRTKADAIVHTFILSILRLLLYMLLAIICLGMLNIQLTPLITALGAVGLAVSLSLKDSLSNVAGGISILWSRPFSKEDYVEVKGMTGTVTEIGLVYTQLLTDDNKRVLLPNGDVAKAIIVNFSTQPMRRLELLFPLGKVEFDREMGIVRQKLVHHPLILEEPRPQVFVADQNAASVTLGCQVWVENDNYLQLKYTLQEDIRRALNPEQSE